MQMKDAVLAIWVANVVSTLGISLVVGERQPERLFFPNLYVFLLLSGLIPVDILFVYARLPSAIIDVTSVVG